MQTWDAIRARRNVRRYRDQPIAREDLERVLEAGRRAPSSQNWQPWHFVVVTGREQLIELAKAWERGGKHIAGSAATIALVAQEAEDQRHHDWLLYDFGQATAFIMLAAAELGIGSGHSAVRDQQQAQRVLGFPDGYLAVYMIGLGYPAGRPTAPPAQQTEPPAVRRGRALAPLVIRAQAQSAPDWEHRGPPGEAFRRPDLPRRVRFFITCR